jgi:hypothetical protein
MVQGTGKTVLVTFLTRKIFQQSLTKSDFAMGSIWFHVLAPFICVHKKYISAFDSKRSIFAVGRTVITSEPFS